MSLKVIPSDSIRGLVHVLFPRPILEKYIKTASDVKELKGIVNTPSKYGSKFDLDYVGENVAFSIKPNATGVKILTNYENAHKELEDAAKTINSKFPDEADKLIFALESAQPKKGDIKDPRIFGYNLATRLPYGLAALFDISDDEKRVIVEDELNKLADQLVSNFRIGNAKEKNNNF